MCLKVQPPWPIPKETGRIGKMLLTENDPYRLIGDQLFEKWKEEEFADLYAGEPKLSSAYRSEAGWLVIFSTAVLNR